MPSPPKEPSRARSRAEESGKPRPRKLRNPPVVPGLHPSLGGEIRILQTWESAARPDLPRPRPSLLPQSLQGLLPVLMWGPEPLQHGLRDPSHQNPGDPSFSCPLAKLQPAQAALSFGTSFDLLPPGFCTFCFRGPGDAHPRPVFALQALADTALAGTWHSAPPSDLGHLLRCPRTRGANTIPRRQPRSSACPMRPWKPRA